MMAIARYRSKDDHGRAHLITQYHDERDGDWLELADGSRLVTDAAGRLATTAGECFTKLIRAD